MVISDTLTNDFKSLDFLKENLWTIELFNSEVETTKEHIAGLGDVFEQAHAEMILNVMMSRQASFILKSMGEAREEEEVATHERQ